MSPSDMEGGMHSAPTGLAGKFQPPWWLQSWRSQIVTGLAVVELLCGVLTAISIFPSCIIGGALQILASIVVLAIEAPIFVSFLSFAAPITAFWENKPVWMRAAAYLGLAIIPGLAGCFGLFYILGFLAAVCIAGIYALSILGPKANRDDMRVAAAGDAYSPTMSP